MRWLIVGGVWLAYLSFGAVSVSLAPLVSIVQADLGMSHSAMGSIMGAWQLVYIAAAVPCGILLDRLEGRWALALGVLLVAASALGRALAHSYGELLIAVMIFGLGGPIISSGAPKIIASVFQGSQRGLAMGIYMTGPTLGSILSVTLTNAVLLPLLGHSWRAVMVLWAGLALVGCGVWFLTASLAGPRVPGFRQTPGPGSTAEPASARVIGVMIRHRAMQLLLTMAVGAFLINHGLNNWLPELLRSGGMAPVDAGYWAALPMVVGLIGSLTIPRLATPERRFRILFALCAAACIASAALTADSNVMLTGALILQGCVRSSLMTVMILTLMDLPGVEARYAGTANGLFFSAAEVGGVLGPLGLGLMYDLTGGFHAGLYVLSGTAAAMALGAVRLSGVRSN